MNIAMLLGHGGKAMMVYDQPLGFVPAWIESSEDGRGLRIIGEEGQEYLAGLLYQKITLDMQRLDDVVMVRMENRQPAECHAVSFVNQIYGDAD